MDIDNRINRIFPSFSSLYFEFSPSHRVIDNFSDCIVFNLHSKQKEDKICIHQLNNMVIESSSFLSTAIVVTDASIKNNTAIFISHMHTHNHPITKTVHHAVHVTSSLFTIRCGINWALNQDGISKIIVVTDSIHIAKKIFDPSLHPFQIYSITILTELCQFFFWHHNNSIEFWECPSHLNRSLHKVVDKETKAFNPMPLFSSKMSWDFSKKSECHDILNI